MTSLEIAGSDLIVRIHGVDRFFAFKRRLRIPLAHIVDIERAGDEARKRWIGVANPGTFLPWMLKAGTFQAKPWGSDRTFWDVRHPRRAIVIRLRDDPSVKLVIEVADVEAAVAQIRGTIAQPPTAVLR